MVPHDQTFARKVRETPHVKLPVIDVGPVLAGDRDGTIECAAQLRDVCENLGFMSIVNHGIEPKLIADMEAETKRFHALPMEQKITLKINRDQRGYVPPRATLVKHSTYNKNTKLDLNATLVLATEYPEDDPGRQAGKQFYGANQWPDDLPGFREVATNYMDRMTALGKRLLPLWAEALELPQDFFDPHFVNNYTYLRLAFYPPKPDLEDNEYGIGAHADTGFMTFLPPAKEAGLQVLDPDGQWFWPEVEDDALIVNAGQFLERWSNGRFRATPHRVIPPTKNERFSVPCFVNTNFEDLCTTLPTCHGPDNPPKYNPETYWDFYVWYMKNTYPHYDEPEENQGAA